ncbi:hypothetical protein VTK56DRAFT_6180 [Thermocarpiscus australiensis]
MAAIPPFIILAAQYHLASWYTECNLLADWRIATTDNGWTTNAVGLDWIKRFDYYTAPRAKGKYRLLILNGHESHHSTKFELYCQESKIITLCMPLHSSHLLQPLDVSCFGPLKQAYGRQIEDLIRMHINHVSKLEFLYGFREAFFTSLTEKNIRGGFAGAGLVPYDPERVLSKLDIKLRQHLKNNEALLDLDKRQGTAIVTKYFTVFKEGNGSLQRTANPGLNIRVDIANGI